MQTSKSAPTRMTNENPLRTWSQLRPKINQPMVLNTASSPNQTQPSQLLGIVGKKSSRVTLPEVVTLNIHQAYSLGSCHMLGRGASGFGSPPHHPGTACRDRQQTKIRKTRNMAKPTTALKKCPGPNLAQHPSCHALCPKVTLWKSFNIYIYYIYMYRSHKVQKSLCHADLMIFQYENVPSTRFKHACPYTLLGTRVFYMSKLHD